MGRNVTSFRERTDGRTSDDGSSASVRGMKTGAGRDWDWRPFVYGGTASCIAELGTFPFDLTKTRLQLQGSRLDNVAIRYRGMFHAFVRIGSEEGLRALYSGIAPALLRQSTYGTLKIGVYYSLKKFLVKSPEDETFHTDMFCGVVAGAVSSTIANPTDVLKVRMQACSQRFRQVTMLQAFSSIYQKEGVRGLWRGVAPTSQRAALIVGIELPVYDMSKVHLMRHFGLLDNEITHFISSAIAGLACALASNPIDVVKTRLMNQARLKAALAPGPAQLIYTSSLDCAVQTVKYEGIRALYKGFVPTYVRMGPWNVIFFMTYEQMKKFY